MFIVKQYCYSTPMTLSPAAIESSINKHRQQEQLRVLWPDYEVQDLLQKGICIWELARFTSAALNIAKFNNLEEILADPLSCKNWTHVAVHKMTQLGPQLNKVEMYYVILSKRGLAVDQLKSKFQRGTYIISAQVAQLQKLICLWGVETISGERHVIGPKYISRSSGMWRIQFESDRPLKNILFYSTRREPKYGKGSTSGSQLPKDAKLQFCMNFKSFSSFLESRMKKEEDMLDNVPSFIPPRAREIIFLQSQSGNKTKKQTEPKVKNEQNSLHRIRSLEPLSKNKEVHVKILPNSAFLEINCIENHDLRCINPVQIRQFIQNKQILMHESLKSKEISNYELKEMLTNLTFAQIQRFCWSDILKLLSQVSRVQDMNHAIEYLLASIIYLFNENNNQKTIQNWLNLNNSLKLIEQRQQRQRFRKWIDTLMFQHCQQILKDSDQQQIEAIESHKDLIIESIQWQLQISNHQSSKISDLLYLLMKIQSKKNIFDLYHSHQIINNSIIITPSIKQWQNTQKFYPKDDSDMLYQTEASIQAIQYQKRSNFQSQKNENCHYDFSLTSSYEKLPKNAFISGKQFSVDSQTFKYFIFIKKSSLEFFVERVESLIQSLSQAYFTSFEISIEITVNNIKKSHEFGWSFTYPSHSIGTTFTFDELDQDSNISFKISFKRKVFHESILNYLRVRFEQFLKMQNKCSDKLQQQNKKLLKRRSSLFLERSLPDDVNFGNSIQDQCFLHGTCQRCQILAQPTSLYKLSPLDLYKLMLSASFKEELNAFLVTIKYLILTPDELFNKQFWLSQIRINHLNLKQMLKLVNKLRLDRDILQIISSLIQQKIKQYGPRQQKLKRKIRFIAKDQSRVGKCMWDQQEADYCEEYLQFLKNAQERV